MHAPIVIEIVKGGVLEQLASADTGVVHEKVYSPESLDGRRDKVTAIVSGGNIAVIRDCLASTWRRTLELNIAEATGFGSYGLRLSQERHRICGCE